MLPDYRLQVAGGSSSALIIRLHFQAHCPGQCAILNMQLTVTVAAGNATTSLLSDASTSAFTSSNSTLCEISIDSLIPAVSKIKVTDRTVLEVKRKIKISGLTALSTQIIASCIWPTNYITFSFFALVLFRSIAFTILLLLLLLRLLLKEPRDSTQSWGLAEVPG